MRESLPLLTLLATVASCNFDEAFQRYCENNPQCPKQDAAPDLASEPDVPSAPDLPSDPYLPGEPDLSSEPDLPSWPDTAGKLPRDGGLGDRSPPPPPVSCVTTNDCAFNEFCHPTNQVCMITCNVDSDCPRYVERCEDPRVPDSPGRYPRVCRCTARGCNSFASGLVCHVKDGLCEPICSSTEDCSTFLPSRVCDEMSGVCQLPSCRDNRDCPLPTQPRCDSTSQLCTRCLDDMDCAYRPDNLTHCDDQTGACVNPLP